jgi:GAF domain-containing protein
MDQVSRKTLTEIAQLAADLGPGLAPTGHDELMISITEAARSIFGAAACSVALLDDSGEELVFYVASGAGAEDVTGMRIPASQGIAGWVLNSGQAISIEDVRRDPRFAADVAEMTGYLPGSILAMPLETDRDVIGVIEVLDRRSSPGRGANDMELLGLFARQAALAIENSRVFTDLGRVLFEALGRAAHDAELVDALKQIAAEARGPRAELADLAAHLHALGTMGEQEQRAGTRLLAEFVTYLEGRRRWS